LAHRRNKLIQRSVGLLVNESEDALGMVLQDRTATPARLRYTHAMIAPTLQPFDRSAGTDLKAFAASRRDALACTASITRSRRSPDSDFGIVVAPTGESMPIDSLRQTA